MKFNPQIGDTIVTKEKGNFICANYCEYVEENGIDYYESYAQKPVFGVSEAGFCVWDYDGKSGADEFDAYNIAKVIPKHQATKEQDLEFRLKSLELENAMLRMLLRKEGVDV